MLIHRAANRRRKVRNYIHDNAIKKLANIGDIDIPYSYIEASRMLFLRTK